VRRLALRRSRLRLLLAFGIVAFAGGLYLALSWAAASSPGVSAVDSTGPIEIRNSGEGTAIFSAEGLVPGWSSEGEVSIANSGGTAGRFRLALGPRSEKLGVLGGRLSDRLRLVVTEIDDGRGTAIYAGPLSKLGSRDLSVLEPGDRRSYHFSMSFPSSGPHGADNAFQGGRVEVAFQWTAVEAPE
jgi:hypothetical protein